MPHKMTHATKSVHRSSCIPGLGRGLRVKRLLVWLVGLFMAAAVYAAPAVAFYYGPQPPWDELQAFDLVVVDPGHVPNPTQPVLPLTERVAYVSVGEVHPSRAYAAKIPKVWLKGDNQDWGSRLIDQAAPDWPRFFSEAVIDPLWAAGYRSFFLDTLDSYHLFAKTPEDKAKQEAGMVSLVMELKRRHPQAKLIFNRGFEILDRTYKEVAYVAAESLFQGYDAGKNSYRPVPTADREWLLGQFKRITQEYRLPVIAIDYVPPGDRALARSTAKLIEAQGFIPWVATPDLATLGVGSVEVMPRRVLIVHSPLANEFELRGIEAVRMATMPLNYLGYAVEYVDYRHLPESNLAGRYAGVVLWLGALGTNADRQKISAWISRRVDENVPMALINEVSPMLSSSLSNKLGLDQTSQSDMSGPVTISQSTSMMGFERQPRPQANEFTPLAIKRGRPLLTLSKGKTQQIAAAIMPWGGYVMDPFGLVTLPSQEEARWVIDPFAFFKEALRLPTMPVPDVTTESGRRMLLVHMDGDGFVSRSELPGNPFAGEVIRDRIVKKFPVPMAISVIEAELSPQGLYRQYAQQLEAVARDIFRSPNVEIASHSYTHPFNWEKAQAAGEAAQGYHLNIPGYRLNLQREIEGSIRYIETRLAPAGKKVALFLWTGNTVAGRDAVAMTKKLGVLNMNGGDTVANLSHPTVTQVEGLGMYFGDQFQVFAPNQNENVYTNNWTGPFSGFERVIETFEFTEKPRRLKPINIYFHTYLTTKLAGLRSLEKVFDYALKQETTPVFASDYSKKAEAFLHVAVARTATGWRVRGADNLHTMRAPITLGVPDLTLSESVAGYKPNPQDTYLHLAGASAELVFTPQATNTVRLDSANATLESVERSTTASTTTFRWALAGHVPLQFTLAHAARCRVLVAGRELTSSRNQAEFSHYQLSTHAARPLEAICRN
jgi:polysaccharide biosynthesis protein PelA